MDAPPVWVFRGVGLLIGFVIAYFFIFKPKKTEEND